MTDTPAKEGTPAADTAKDAKDTSLGKWIGLGVGAGIGSAALAAALLYANRTKKTK